MKRSFDFIRLLFHKNENSAVTRLMETKAATAATDERREERKLFGGSRDGREGDFIANGRQFPRELEAHAHTLMATFATRSSP